MNIKQFFLVAVTIFLTFGFAYSDDPGEWNKWRGPNANGIANSLNWNPNALQTKAVIDFTTNVGMGHSAVAVNGKFLYTMGSDYISKNGQKTYHDVVFCLDSKTGREVWRYAYEISERQDPGPGSTPVIDGSSLYTIGRDGQLFCFDAQTGSIRWQRNMITESLANKHSWGFTGSPVIDGDLLILNANKSGIAFNKHTGKLLWNSDFGKSGYATPVLFTLKGKRFVAISSGEGTFIIDVVSGNIQWRHPWKPERDPLIFKNNILIIGIKGSAFLKIHADSSEVIWQIRYRCASFQSWVRFDNYVYGLGTVRKNHVLQCLDLETGELKWSEKTAEWGSLIGCDNKLIFLDGSGKLIIINATPEGYQEIAARQVLKMNPKNYDPKVKCFCWTNPVLVDGNVYVRNNYGELARIDMTKEKEK